MAVRLAAETREFLLHQIVYTSSEELPVSCLLRFGVCFPKMKQLEHDSDNSLPSEDPLLIILGATPQFLNIISQGFAEGSTRTTWICFSRVVAVLTAEKGEDDSKHTLKKLRSVQKKKNEESSIAYTQAEIKVWKVHEMPVGKLCCIYVYITVRHNEPNQQNTVYSTQLHVRRTYSYEADKLLIVNLNLLLSCSYLPVYNEDKGACSAIDCSDNVYTREEFIFLLTYYSVGKCLETCRRFASGASQSSKTNDHINPFLPSSSDLWAAGLWMGIYWNFIPFYLRCRNMPTLYICKQIHMLLNDFL